MEKDASRGGDGFSISDNKSASNKMGRRRFDGGGAGDGGGPTGGGANEAVGHMLYYDNVSSSRLGAENFSTTNSQPFDIFASSSSSKSPEGIMATSVAFPFTSAQWKELERQAMIYKYMIYSVPVPSDLLLPLSRNLTVDSSGSSMYSVRYSKHGDLEPGRCKRTDGKKWRCSKDVAPNQKYCERHLHRGRPRSRKPVEDKSINGESNKKTQRNPSSSTANPHHFSATNEKPLLLFDPKNDLNISNAPSCNRDLSLMMMESELKRQRFIEANLGFSNGGCSIYGSSSLFDQDYADQNQLNVYSNFATSEIDAPISFIDAWSIENGNVESSGPREPESLSTSLNLSISMASGRHSDQDDFGPVYWGPFTGGPLGEALPGGKNPASPHDSVTTVATTVESPTGVLHRTLFSNSDGSVCNSPTFPAPMSEVAFRWLN
ncbi:hypothetical protein ACS0TY_000219 [Phlomoides rotata]